MTAKTGLDALLTPERSVLLLIDHQAFQFANLHSHDPTLIINNVVGLAKAAKAFKVPTILTTVTEDRGPGWAPPQGHPGCLSRAEADQSDLPQFMGRPARREGGEGDRAEAARRCSAVDGNLPRVSGDPEPG